MSPVDILPLTVVVVLVVLIGVLIWRGNRRRQRGDQL